MFTPLFSPSFSRPSPSWSLHLGTPAPLCNTHANAWVPEAGWGESTLLTTNCLKLEDLRKMGRLSEGCSCKNGWQPLSPRAMGAATSFVPSPTSLPRENARAYLPTLQPLPYLQAAPSHHSAPPHKYPDTRASPQTSRAEAAEALF